MAKLVFALNQSLDGYIDHTAFKPDPSVFSHFMEQVRRSAAALYGRRTYEVMRYWEEDQPDWDDGDHQFATAWRALPKWVASRTLTSVGPNATLIRDNLEAEVRRLKAQLDGQIDVAGPDLAKSLTTLGLIDEYQLYFHPVVLGHGKPFFAAPRPPLRLTAHDRIGDNVIRLTYVPA